MAIGSGILTGRKEIVESKLLNQLCFVAYFFKGSETKFVLVGFPSVTWNNSPEMLHLGRSNCSIAYRQITLMNLW